MNRSPHPDLHVHDFPMRNTQFGPGSGFGTCRFCPAGRLPAALARFPGRRVSVTYHRNPSHPPRPSPSTVTTAAAALTAWPQRVHSKPRPHQLTHGCANSALSLQHGPLYQPPTHLDTHQSCQAPSSDTLSSTLPCAVHFRPRTLRRFLGIRECRAIQIYPAK